MGDRPPDGLAARLINIALIAAFVLALSSCCVWALVMGS